uniref:hypothetical protein n=1 Tax=Tessaracoccus coleopterorum TaxID=2714950 RepID=UPI001E476F2D
MRERGVDYDHLERANGVGGIWDIDAPGTPMYESAHFISSRTASAFSGYPMPETYPDYPGTGRSSPTCAASPTPTGSPTRSPSGPTSPRSTRPVTGGG